MQAHLELVEARDDLAIEFITLLNLLARPEEAFRRLMQRNFHPWEGGEGKASGQYVTCLVEMAKTRLAGGETLAAIELLKQAQIYPQTWAKASYMERKKITSFTT